METFFNGQNSSNVPIKNHTELRRELINYGIKKTELTIASDLEKIVHAFQTKNVIPILIFFNRSEI